ncbi:MAG: C4-dicarboxylate ABC transporter permease [Bacillota bacterium]|nr:C4-dicarboxylate ABC transporter permease [Bacillota bacterium]
MSSSSVKTDTGPKKKFRLRVPHVYVLLIMIMIIAAIASYVMPAGEYVRVKDEATGRMVIDPTTFQEIEKTPVGLFSLALAIPEGMANGVDIIFLIILVCASFEIVNATGAFNTGIAYLVKKLAGKESIVIAGVTILFSTIGAFLGWAEGVLVFIPLGVALSKAMGYDALLGMGMVVLGTGAGFAGGVTNIYTVGVAQAIAKLPLFSGLGFRFVAYVTFTIITIVFLLLYAKKLKKDPEISPVHDVKLATMEEIDLSEMPKFTARHKGVIAVVIAGFVITIYGTINLGWFLRQISAMFILVGIAAGFVGGFTPSEMAEHFANGAKAIIFGAVTTGLARSILVVMEKGHIIDSVIHSLAGLVEGLPTIMAAMGMYCIQLVMNFFIPSGSGQAVTTMPIMAPLADIVGTTRQVAVLAFQYGDSFTNALFPTSGVLLAGLAMAGGIPWDRWAKWVWKLMLAWIVSAGVFVTIAHFIKLGPF